MEPNQIDGLRESTTDWGLPMSRYRTPVLSDAPPTAFRFSDDESVQRLAQLIEHRDNKNLAEIAAPIARLAVPIES
jgi:hypothetical protein